MKLHKIIAMGGIAAVLVTATGCSLMREDQPSATESDVTPTAEPTNTPAAQPTEVPLTVTPIPTSTPAPRIIGTKNAQSNFIYMTNSTAQVLREVHLKVSDAEEWGKNLVPNESTIKIDEKVQLFYEKPSSEDVVYDMKIVDKTGNSYAIYRISLTDIENAELLLQDGSALLKYTSVSSNTEMTTDSSETLAQDYSSQIQTEDSSSDSTTTHEGDYDYGYYDYNGNWVEDSSNTEYYSDNTSSYSYDNSYNYSDSYSDNYSNDYSNGTGDDYYGPTDYDPNMDYSAYEGNTNYGYYDDYGNWVSYY